MESLYYLTIARAHQLLKSRAISSVELTKAVLKRINQAEPKINSFITLTADLALKQAFRVDKKIKNNQPISKLAGIPVSIKDVFVTKNIKTTSGSKILSNYFPQYDATVMQRLLSSDAVILGKTNQDEFAYGFTTETSHFKTTCNPWDLSRTAGGSSGGSAASVAAGEAIYSLASEHYDSIRQPAAWTGVVGFKPTYGLVSRYGIIAMASSLECPGPVCRAVEDVAICLEYITGYDSHDANSLKKTVPKYSLDLIRPIKNLVFGLPKEYLSGGIESGVKKRVVEAIKVLEKLGAKIREIKLLPAEYSSAVYDILYAAEVASNLSRYDGIRYGYRVSKGKDLNEQYFLNREVFGPMIKYQILTDLRSLSGGEFDKIYHQSLKVRRLIKNDFESVFKKVDLIIGPMSPCVAFKKGFYKNGQYLSSPETDRLKPLVNMYSQPPTLVGLPGISLPCGFVNGLPVGLQIYGPLFSESKILQAAYAYEQATQCRKFKAKIK